jgi:hypothetical protein
MTGTGDFSPEHRRRIVDAAPPVSDETIQQLRMRLAAAPQIPLIARLEDPPSRTDIGRAA